MEKLRLRPALPTDCDLLWQWANDASVRQNSFKMEQIPLKDHIEWFKMVLTNEDTKLFILQEEDTPIGQVRLVYDTNVWQISYSIALPYRAQGYGKIILQLAENELIRGGHVGEKLYAEVKADNIASQCIFKDLGYSEAASQHDNAYAYTKVITKEQKNGIE